MSKVSEHVQKIIHFLAYPVLFILGIVCGKHLLHHGESASGAGELAAEAERNNRDALDAVRRAEDDQRELEERLDAIGRSAQELGANDRQIADILAEIRRQEL